MWNYSEIPDLNPPNVDLTVKLSVGCSALRGWTCRSWARRGGADRARRTSWLRVTYHWQEGDTGLEYWSHPVRESVGVSVCMYVRATWFVCVWSACVSEAYVCKCMFICHSVHVCMFVFEFVRNSQYVCLLVRTMVCQSVKYFILLEVSGH